jgi:hypothetical protein
MKGKPATLTFDSPIVPVKRLHTIQDLCIIQMMCKDKLMMSVVAPKTLHHELCYMPRNEKRATQCIHNLHVTICFYYMYKLHKYFF